jgi:hypothetical protein
VDAGEVDLEAALEAGAEEDDVVVSALGPQGRGPTTVCSDGTRSVVEAMAQTGVRRLLVVSVAGIPPDQRRTEGPHPQQH